MRNGGPECLFALTVRSEDEEAEDQSYGKRCSFIILMT